MKPLLSQRGWSTIELVGLPGIGKSTVAHQLVASLGDPAVRTRTGPGHRAATVRALMAMCVRPSRLRQSLRITTLVLRGVEGRFRPRARRAWKVAKALARIGVRPRTGLVLDEGPISWIVTPAWHDDELTMHALRELVEYYDTVGCLTVVLDGSPELARQRQRDRVAEARPTRSGAPGLERRGLVERADLLSRVTSELDEHAGRIHVLVGPDDSPIELASKIVARLGPQARGVQEASESPGSALRVAPSTGVDSARPTVYMIVEIKVRELRAKLLLAQKMADRGLRVYLGSRDAVTAAIRSRQRTAGVYYFKGGEPQHAFAEARHHCEHVVGQDEEIGPALSPEDVRRAWATRYSPEIVAMIDQVFAYSSNHVDILHEVCPSLAAKAHVTGWPRADLWRPGLRGPDERRADAIRQRHGAFVLFPSNFKINSAAQRDHVIAFGRDAAPGRAVSHAMDASAPDDLDARATHRLESFHRAAAMLRELAGSGAGPIIVRPHPAESPNAWEAALTGVSGVHIVADDSAGPWLMAARGVIHAGCTTAVEAASYGVPCGYLQVIDYQPDDFVECASWQASTPLAGVDQAAAFVRAAIDGSLSRVDRGMPAEVFGPQHGLASDRIAEAIAALDITPEPPLPRRRGVAVQRGAARTVAWWPDSRWSRARFTGTNAQRKLPGGIHLPEARRILDGLAAHGTAHVVEPRFDLLQIER